MGGLDGYTTSDKLREDVDKLESDSTTNMTTNKDSYPSITSPYQIKVSSDLNKLVSVGWVNVPTLNELYKDKPIQSENVVTSYPAFTQFTDKKIKGLELKLNCYVSSDNTTKYNLALTNPNTFQTSNIISTVKFDTKELLSLGKCKTDLSDLRVIYGDGELPFYLDSSTINTEETTIYLLSPTISAGETVNIEMVFSGATSELTSVSTTNIYILYEQFENANRWIMGNTTLADGIVTLDTTSTDVSFGLINPIDIPNNTIIEFDYYSESELKFNVTNGSDRIVQCGATINSGAYVYYFNNSWAWINGVTKGNIKPNARWNKIKIIRYNNTFSLKINDNDLISYTNNEFASKWFKFSINWYFVKGSSLQKIKNFTVQNYAPLTLTSTVTTVSNNETVPIEYPNFNSLGIQIDGKTHYKYCTTKWDKIDYVGIGGDSDLWNFDSDTIKQALVDGNLKLEFNLNGGVSTQQTIIKFGVLNVYFESDYTDEANAILNRLNILGISINKCDKWIEFAKPKTIEELNIKFTKQYLELPAVIVTTEKDGYSDYTMTFKTEQSLNNGTMYTGVVIKFKNFVAPESLTYTNVTIIGRALNE